MNAAAQNTFNAPVFEIPDPPEEFGQDGGKFYRCYDALAEEIDEDMTKGLKEQLDGMLIFAGLFAGVNSAFLALTIPLLSADPADDTNALLAQNNAILTQLVMGRNDSIPANTILPSAAFSPSRDIFTINALFALSLAFAIISSFLAVLGRQWLVYYRKRSGGGPDRQRWEQLKRFLGAERWRLEAILDDVLPSLLQIGLIIFCASLVLYFRYLNPAIPAIIGVPISVGLAFFIGSAFCTIWDRAWRAVRETIPIVNTVVGDRLLGRKEEGPELLQIIALRRTICTSDDPITLLHATANLLTVRDPVNMKRLWDDVTFHQRFLELFQNVYNVMLQLRGHNPDPRDVASRARRLYCGATLNGTTTTSATSAG
ncbi:hypothetical protein FRC00_004304 [Tulasnella sp. 408]|nr:hypothetical protein FRC00_004304 [Tulasnella sp. 408]